MRRRILRAIVLAALAALGSSIGSVPPMVRPVEADGIAYRDVVLPGGPVGYRELGETGVTTEGNHPARRPEAYVRPPAPDGDATLSGDPEAAAGSDDGGEYAAVPPATTLSPVALDAAGLDAGPIHTAAAGPRMKGVNVFLSGDRSKNAGQLRLAREAGAGLVRATLGWRDIEPTGKGRVNTWALAALDGIVADAERQGLKLVLGLARPPCWASGDPNKNCAVGRYNQWYPPSNPADYGAALRILAGRYGPRVLAWEVWNEPNYPAFWGGRRPDAARYVQLVKAAKAANPTAFILAGAVANTDAPYITAMYDAGIKGHFDALSIHPYVWMDPRPGGTPEDCRDLAMSLKCGVPKVRELMLARGDDKPIWFTEFGWTSQWIGEATQADYLRRAFAIIDGFPYVRVAATYAAVDRGYTIPGFPTADRECCFGLYRADSSAKPAAAAFRNAALR